MKRTMAVLAGLAMSGTLLAGVATADHNTNHKGYSTKCSDHSTFNGKPSSSTVYQSNTAAERKGYAGVTGSNGYIEAGGDASGSAPTGAVHGTTAGGEFYGHVGDDRVCVGSGNTKQNIVLP